ncbi:MAG: PEGA domain-containing protein [Ignavibacteriales bacterium]|nr:PEGA domain-containing protein [Ignavibacteriales bacterium]
MKKSLYFLSLFISAIIAVSCNKEVSVSPEDPIIHTGYLFVESNPTKAAIYLNGKNTGKFTSDSIRWLESGDYRITLRLKGWRDSVFKVSVNEKIKTNLAIDFTTNPLMCGEIAVTSWPVGVAVFINSENTGKVTPATIKNLLPGSYKIKLFKERYWEDTLTVGVQSQMTTTVFRALADTAVWVAYKKGNCPLPSNTITSISVDKNNVKWIATDGAGIATFDDKNWTIYNTSNSPLPENRISVIYIDPQDNKWFGTSNFGLVKFDGSNWTTYDTYNSGLPSNMIITLATDLNGNLCIGTYDKGIVVFDGVNWKVYNTSNSGIPSNIITAFTVDQKGNYWVGTAMSGVAKYDGKEWQKFNDVNANIPIIVTALATDGLGNVWGGFTSFGLYSGGIFKYDEVKGWSLYSGSFSDRLSCIVPDSHNYLWIGSYNNGMGLIEGRFIYRDIFNGSNSPIHNNIVNSIAVDNGGYKWIGTSADGLLKFKNKR